MTAPTPRQGTNTMGPSVPSTAGSSSATTTSNNKKEADDTEQSWIATLPNDVQRFTLDTWKNMEGVYHETKRNFALNRPVVTALILAVLLSGAVALVMAVMGAGGLALLTCPLWLPIALLTCPLWIPLTLLSSPIWMTAGVTVAVCVALGGGTVLAVLLFFTWPAEWLFLDPYGVVEGYYLKPRDAVTMWLAKLCHFR